MQHKTLCSLVVFGLVQGIAATNTYPNYDPLNLAEELITGFLKYLEAAAVGAKNKSDTFWSDTTSWLKDEWEQVGSSDVPEEAEEYVAELLRAWNKVRSGVATRVDAVSPDASAIAANISDEVDANIQAARRQISADAASEA